MFCADVNECMESPCANSGTCVNQENGFTCMCEAGFTGDTCTEGSIALNHSIIMC